VNYRFKPVGWVRASVLGNIGEEKRVAAGALGAIDTGSGGGVDGGVSL
jgi:hypothetical protein